MCQVTYYGMIINCFLCQI